MREIKFRVWDKLLKRMLSWEWVHDNFFSRIFDYPNMIPMQYTGIEDKSGKEIYEGDLIQNEYGRICEVVWMEHAGCWDAHVRKFGAESKGGHLGFQNNEWPRHVIIIGNIYENPELLETK